MRFEALPLPGAWLVHGEPHRDERGSFTRLFCAREFADAGLVAPVVQISLSGNRLRGTLRGLHYQDASAPEEKLVRCVQGALFDVIVDARPDSPTADEWLGIELRGDAPTALYVPAGFAHGFLTLADDTEVLYQVSNVHTPSAERGIRWDDPAIGVEWPAAPVVMSDKDRNWPLRAQG